MKRLIIIISAVAVALTGCYSDPVADFSYTPANPVAGEEIFFENLSYDAASFQWEFGDGYGSAAYDPRHSFASAGTYTVTLKAFGANSGIDVAYATINVTSVDPYADFYITTDLNYTDIGIVATETDIVFVGEQVTFNNISTNAASVFWEFGDNYTSTEFSPSWSYDDPGTYTVTLNAYGMADEADTYSKVIHVVDGINSTIRITVKEYYEEYPVEDVRVKLYPTLDDWNDETNASEPVRTTELGKCVFEGLNEQHYYIDAYREPAADESWYDNYLIAEIYEPENDLYGIDFIETQFLEADFIHDFIAYVDLRYPDTKKSTLRYVGSKELSGKDIPVKKSTSTREKRNNKFSKTR